MKHFIFLLAVLSLACGVSAQLPTATQTPTITPIRIRKEEVMKSTEKTVEYIPMVVYNSGGLNFHIRPGQGEPLISEPLEDGTIVNWTGNEKVLVVVPWYQVVTSDGLMGWVFSTYLRRVK